MTPLEKAATAVAGCMLDAPVPKDFSLADVNGWGEEKAYEIARAVLLAVKDTDAEVVNAGLAQWSNLRDMFDAMIDAIVAGVHDDADPS